MLDKVRCPYCARMWVVEVGERKEYRWQCSCGHLFDTPFFSRVGVRTYLICALAAIIMATMLAAMFALVATAHGSPPDALVYSGIVDSFPGVLSIIEVDDKEIDVVADAVFDLNVEIRKFNILNYFTPPTTKRRVPQFPELRYPPTKISGDLITQMGRINPDLRHFKTDTLARATFQLHYYSRSDQKCIQANAEVKDQATVVQKGLQAVSDAIKLQEKHKPRTRSYYGDN